MNIDILVKCISMVCEVFKAYLAYRKACLSHSTFRHTAAMTPTMNV